MGIGTYILVSLVKIALALLILLTAVAYTTLLERKLVAHMQNRWGPSRVGPFGIWQPLADRLQSAPLVVELGLGDRGPPTFEHCTAPTGRAWPVRSGPTSDVVMLSAGSDT